MRAWNEIDIGIVYFSGLVLALVTGILVVLYLGLLKATIQKIAGRFVRLWRGSFKTTIILGSLLGAMSVSFRSCDGSYDALLESKQETILKGCEQLSASFEWVALVLGIWLVIFVLLRLTLIKNKDSV